MKQFLLQTVEHAFYMALGGLLVVTTQALDTQSREINLQNALFTHTPVPMCKNTPLEDEILAYIVSRVQPLHENEQKP